MAERQRRKAARETNQPPAKSLVSDVTRRASLLWTGRKSQHVSRPSRNDRGLGTHAALQSQDSVDVVPLGDIETAGVDSPSTSPLPGQHSVNPFDHPSDPVSPFADQSAVMDASSNPPTPSAQIDNTKQNTPKRPTLMQSSSSLGPPPTPKPLDLPPPRTPPPPNGQLQPTPSPSVSPPPNEERGEPKPTRWWHDWLCGLSEGDDRGGDDQVSFYPFFSHLDHNSDLAVSRSLGWQDKPHGIKRTLFYYFTYVHNLYASLSLGLWPCPSSKVRSKYFFLRVDSLFILGWTFIMHTPCLSILLSSPCRYSQ